MGDNFWSWGALEVSWACALFCSSPSSLITYAQSIPISFARGGTVSTQLLIQRARIHDISTYGDRIFGISTYRVGAGQQTASKSLKQQPHTVALPFWFKRIAIAPLALGLYSSSTGGRRNCSCQQKRSASRSPSKNHLRNHSRLGMPPGILLPGIPYRNSYILPRIRLRKPFRNS